MKVYLRDKRANPRVIYIDGKRFVLPSSKEVVQDISRSAFNNLSAMGCISIREYVEEENVEVQEEVVEEREIKAASKPNEVKPAPTPDVDVSGLVVEDKLEDSTIVSPVEEPKAEEPKAEEPKAEEPKSEEPKSEEPKAEETKPDYSSMTKTQLKEVVKEKGGDPSGMTKANLLDWLNSHA